MLTWLPDGSTPLIEASETETNLSANISVTSAEGGEVTLTYEIEDPLELFDIQVDGASLDLFAEHLVGFFPIIHIKYLQNKIYKQCTDWEDLPEDAEDVISFKRDASGIRTLNLTVNAEDTTLGTVESMVYQIVVRADYTGSKNRLQSEVNKRR